MTTGRFIFDYWHLNWVAVSIAVLLLYFHLSTNNYRLNRKSFYFFSGVFLLLLVTVSPIYYLGLHYLFSAHMIETIVLLLIVPPMLLAGTGPEFPKKMHQSWFRKTGDLLFSPAMAWLIGMGTMYFWHIPGVFGTMMGSPVLHDIRMVSLLVLGIIFIWPVYAPVEWRKLEPMTSILYLFIACVGCTILGILITFSTSPVYISYYTWGNTAVAAMLRNSWQITQMGDQEAAGLIMWVPACIIYITNSMVILARMFGGAYEFRKRK